MLNRRNFIAVSGATTLGGCVTCSFPESRSVSGPVSDAHAHFFNAADLPIHNFVRYVVVPEHAPDVPGVALALADLVLWVAKRLTISATAEIKHLGNGEFFGRDNVEPKEFGREVAKRQESVLNRAGAKSYTQGDPDTELAASYYALARHLGAFEEGGPSIAADGTFDGPVRIDERVYEEIAWLGGSAPERRSPQPLGLSEEFARLAQMSSYDVKTIIKWAFMMCQSRCSHVRRYQRTIATTNQQVTHATNLLVDYDRWLGDRPLGNSSHAEQVAFWTAYSARTATIPGWTRLHTFVGYDPLKDAGERLSGVGETSFAKMKSWFEEGRKPGSTATHKVSGFKLYPPMGFFPHENTGDVLRCGLQPCERAAAEVTKWWVDEKGWTLDRLGTELDTSLEAFFKYCAQKDAPILAHASRSNGSMRGADWKADFQHWIPRVKDTFDDYKKPLRLCLAHIGHYRFLDKAKLEELLSLNMGGVTGVPQGRIYLDVSYDEGILESNEGAVARLLTTLAEISEKLGDDGRFVTFGSDWIMLGQQPTANRYLENFRRMLSNHGYWAKYEDQVMRTNFLDFMNIQY